MNKCYKCETALAETNNAVHELCPTCQTDFDNWFAQMLGDM